MLVSAKSKPSNKPKPQLPTVYRPPSHKILFLNGPRHSGKDTIGQIIYSHVVDVRLKKFAEPLKQACAAFFGVSQQRLQQLEAIGNRDKLVPCEQFFGLSWVEALIWFSEDCAKPKFGPEVFGQLLVNNCQQITSTKLTVITDSGFHAEAMPIIKHFGAANCYLWRLHREGCAFTGDSRDYWQDDRIYQEDIQNTHTLDILKVQVLRRIKVMGLELVTDINL